MACIQIEGKINEGYVILVFMKGGVNGGDFQFDSVGTGDFDD